MKISSINSEKNNENNKNNKNNPSILPIGLDLFKSYISYNYKKLSNKIYSFYSCFSKSEKQNLTSSSPIQNTKTNINKNILNNSNNNIIQNMINNKKNELLLFNNFQIKKNIYKFLENELKVNDTKIELRNCNNQKLQIKIYNEFKNKIFIFFFSSTIILKYYNIISITSLCVLSLMKKIKVGNIFSNIVINKKQITLLLDNLWNISTETSKNIYSNLSEIILNKIDKIALNEKYNKDKLINLFENIMNEIRDKCNFFINIIKIIRNNINNLENQYFDKLDVKNNMLYEYKLRFYYIFCDILYSDMFYSSFVESYEKEIKKEMETIKGYFNEQNEKKFSAIIFDLESYKTKQIIINENINEIENNEDINNQGENNEQISDEILFNYQNCLQSIYI